MFLLYPKYIYFLLFEDTFPYLDHMRTSYRLLPPEPEVFSKLWTGIVSPYKNKKKKKRKEKGQRRRRMKALMSLRKKLTLIFWEDKAHKNHMYLSTFQAHLAKLRMLE